MDFSEFLDAPETLEGFGSFCPPGLHPQAVCRQVMCCEQICMSLLGELLCCVAHDAPQYFHDILPSVFAAWHTFRTFMPEISQSEVAATIFFRQARSRAKNWAKFWAKFWEHFRACSLYRITQKTFPQIPRNLSLPVLRMRCQNFISVSFWGWGVPRTSVRGPGFRPGRLTANNPFRTQRAQILKNFKIALRD